jgi:hypothetical protein
MELDLSPTQYLFYCQLKTRKFIGEIEKSLHFTKMATKVEIKTDKAPSMDQTKFPFSQAVSSHFYME